MPLYLLLVAFAIPPLLHQTFDDGETGWTVMGKSGSVHAAQQSLVFDYTVGDGFTLAALPLGGKSMAALKLIRFRVKTDVPTAVAIMLNEKKPGGNYLASFWSTGNSWQTVELTPDDFHLNEGPNDPKDPDGMLDLDQIEAIVLIDLAHIFSAAPADPNLGLAIDRRLGKHSLSIADFDLLAEGPAAAPALTIDDFHSPELQWATLGGAALAPERRGMRALYSQEEGNNAILVRQLPRADFRKGVSIAFDISSEQPAELVLSLEERSPGKQQGARANAVVEVPGGGQVSHRAVLLSAFDNQLELDRLKTFSIIDITAATSHETVKNSLWIGNIRVVTNAPRP
jgi:hypothetical protein